jgi:hypothetical protein
VEGRISWRSRRADELPALIAGAGFEGISVSTERQTRGRKGAYNSSDFRIVLPELVEANGADAIKRQLIPFCLASSRVRR